MRWKLVIFLSYISIALNGQAVLYSECDHPVAHDFCANAPSPTLCEIDGFTATTDNFTVGNDAIEALTDLFCGPNTYTHDNMWIKFVAEGNRLSFKVDINYCEGVEGCIGQGIQLAIAETDCESNFNSLACLNCDASVPLTADVVPGNTYFLMIDGCCGDICEFVINVLEGVAGTTIDIEIPEESVCKEDDTKTLVANMTPLDGEYYYHWYTSNGLILSDTTQQSVVVSGVGEYFVDVHEAITCCDEIQSIDLGVDPTAPIVSVQDPGTVTCTNPIVVLNGSFEGVNGQTYSTKWFDENNDRVFDQNVSEAGVYTYIARNNGTTCSDTQTVTVVVDTLHPNAMIISNDTLDCETENTIYLLGNLSTPANQLDYQWFDGNGSLIAVSANHTSNSEGTQYKLIVENQNNGCIDETTMDILDERGAPIVDAGPDQTIDCNVHTVTLNASAEIGAAVNTNFLFEWFDQNGFLASNDQNFTTITEDTYTLVVTNKDSGCSADDEIIITNGVNFPSITILAPTTITCSNILVTLDASTSLGNSLGYEWSDADGNILGHGEQLIVPDTGFYYLALQDTISGCITKKTNKVIEDFRPPDDVTSIGGIINCLNESVTLKGSSSTSSNEVSFAWEDESGQVLSLSDTVTISNIGNYYFVATFDSTGCTATSTSIVSTDVEAPELVILASHEILNCETLEIDINLISNATNLNYNWEGPGIISNSDRITVSQPGVFNVTITNTNNGCTSVGSKTITQDIEAPTATVNIPEVVNCFHPSIQLEASLDDPQTTFSWTTSNGNFIGAIDVLTPTINRKGRYFLHLTSLRNHCENTYKFDVLDDFELPSVGAGPTHRLDCKVESYEIGTGQRPNTSYQWVDENDIVLGASHFLTVNDPGTYTVIATQTISGCTASDEVTITEDLTKPAVSISANTNIRNCTKPVFTISGETDIVNPEYLWTGPNSLSVSTRNLNITSSGTYQLEIRNPDNGCTDTDTIEINDDFVIPKIQMSSPELLTCDRDTIQLGFSTVDDTSGYLFEWTDENGHPIGENSEVLVSGPGKYTLVTKNTFNGCTSLTEVDVEQNIIHPSSDAGADKYMDCITSSTQLDGQATSNQITPAFEYVWFFDGNQIGTTENIEVTGFGTYELEITDTTNGCKNLDEVDVIPDREDPTARASFSNTITCKDTVSVVNGLGSTTFTNGNTLTYEWYDNGILIDSISMSNVIKAGPYQLIVKDESNHCVDSITITVLENKVKPPLPDMQADTITCGVQTVLLDGLMPDNNLVVYAWYNDNMDTLTVGDPKYKTSQVGNYNLVVTDKINGCTSILEVEVPENRIKPFAEALVDDEIDCTTREIILLTGNSSKEHVNYNWDGPGIIPETDLVNPRVNAPGEYRLVIQDVINRCSDSASVEVIEIENDLYARAKSYDEICLNTKNGIIEVESLEGGTAPYEYSINDSTFSDNLFFEGLAPGEYDVTVKDARGCLFYQNFEINAWELPYFDVGPDVTISIGESVQLNPDYSDINVDSMVWNTDDLNGFNPEIYPLGDRDVIATVVDENGCRIEDQMRIFVDLNYPIYVPNAFTPNHDGINDVFYIFTENNAVKTIHTLIILDRWGELVFENHDFLPNDRTQGWDGLFNGNVMQMGVFVYYFEVEFVDGEKKEFEGDITLIL